MSTLSTPIVTMPVPVLPVTWSLADLRSHLGDIPLERIRIYPSPGLATVEDALRLGDCGEAICELVDGVLVEKPMGTFESVLAMTLGYLLMKHLDHDAQGIVLDSQGTLKILPTKMRIPDVSFIRWDRFPGGKLPEQRVYEMAPDLAVEIISHGNTEKEMEKKLDEYFEAGVRLVWYIYPSTKSAHIYTSRSERKDIGEQGLLEGHDVLPGFAVRLGELFDRATRSPGS